MLAGDLGMRDQFTHEGLKALHRAYNPSDCRTWPFFPIVMPTKDGRGPASDVECDQITWEVWDIVLRSHASFDNMPDAINLAMKMTNDLFAGA